MEGAHGRRVPRRRAHRASISPTERGRGGDVAPRSSLAGRGSAILEHPLNAVIWLAEDLRRAGITLKPGDLLALGSFSRLMPPQPGTAARVVYEGLPGNPSVSVRFR